MRIAHRYMSERFIMDLLKLKLKRTENVVGNNWRSYLVDGELIGVEAVLVRVTDGHYPETLEIMILEESDAKEPQICTAKFIEMGINKINMIKAVRECTDWGLKESKDWVETMPHTMTPRDGFSRQVLAKMVQSTNAAGGKAEMTIGNHCDGCELRFRCFTER